MARQRSFTATTGCTTDTRAGVVHLSLWLVLAVIMLLPTVSEAVDGGLVIKWTAPGNDGYSGRAAVYDLRYQEQSRGPLNTESEWRSAHQVFSEPHPSRAGQRDSAIVNSLEQGRRYYFCIRTRDQAGNWSVLSNSPLLMAGQHVNCCSGQRGNADCDPEHTIDGVDLSVILDHLFINMTPLCCPEETDVSGDNSVDGADLSYFLDHLFINLTPMPSCD